MLDEMEKKQNLVAHSNRCGCKQLLKDLPLIKLSGFSLLHHFLNFS
jgi:hypothetical protein